MRAERWPLARGYARVSGPRYAALSLIRGKCCPTSVEIASMRAVEHFYSANERGQWTHVGDACKKYCYVLILARLLCQNPLKPAEMLGF